MNTTRDYPQLRFEYAPGVSINYEKLGDGPASAIFLHGFGASLDSWNDIKPLLPREGFTHWFIDLKGFGMLRADLEIRFAGAVQRGHKQAGRLGCRFVALTPAQEHQLQKFITQVQREERLRLAGG